MSSDVYVFFCNGKPIIEWIRGLDTNLHERLAWCRAKDMKRCLRVWRSCYPWAKIQAVRVPKPEEKP